MISTQELEAKLLFDAFSSFEEASSSLEKSYCELQERVQQLSKRLQEAERMAGMAEMAVEVAHEIRNPLAALELFVWLLQDESLSREERNQYLYHMQIGIRSLNTVLTNMLSFSRQPNPVKESVSLGALLQEIVSFMTPLLEQRGIEVVQDFKDQQNVCVDREMVRQVFTNLIMNALQALAEGGRLVIKTFSGPGVVSVSLWDNGIGIPEQSQNKIFDPGFSTRQKGSGLGLAIVNRIVEVHQGQIQMKSNKGSGTEFTLTFPVEATS